MLAGDMADENAMFVFETDGAFALCVFDLWEDAEDGIAREEAVERKAKPLEATDLEGRLSCDRRSSAIDLAYLQQKRDDWAKME